MLEIKNHDLWGKVIKEAIAKAAANPGSRKAKNWATQIARAAVSVEENPYLSYENGKLIVLSDVSLNVYEVDEYCDCKGAVEFGRICWHRVAKRLWENYLEAEFAADVADLETEVILPTVGEMINAPYLPPSSNKKSEKLGGVRF